MNSLLSRLRGKVRVWRDWLRAVPRRVRLRFQVRGRRFSVISCNCWGAEIYRDLGMPYLTPFVGLYILPDDYLALLENYPAMLSSPLEFTVPRKNDSGRGYPVGLLDGRIEIHFVHYEDEAEARDKWERRCARLVRDLDSTFFMICDRDGCTGEHLERFERLPFSNKVAFVAHPMAGLAHAVVVPPRDVNASEVEEGPILYRQCHGYFSMANWLNAATPRP